MDNATLNFPRFDKMGLEDAKKAFVKWVDSTWDFNKKIEVWAEPNSRVEVLFLLHEGTKVQMLDQLQEWQKIRISNGSEGWVKDGKLRSLKGFK